MNYQEYFGETHNILRQSIRTFMEREVHPYIDEWEEEDDWTKKRLLCRPGNRGDGTGAKTRLYCYTTLTSVAAGPFCPWVTTNSTRSPSFRDLNPSPLISL